MRDNYMYDTVPDPPDPAGVGTLTDPTEDAKASFHCQEMSDQAEADENYLNKCLYGEKVFYYPYPKGLLPGHIYSFAGRDEFYISRCCEYHFDEMFKEEDDE